MLRTIQKRSLAQDRSPRLKLGAPEGGLPKRGRPNAQNPASPVYIRYIIYIHVHIYIHRYVYTCRYSHTYMYIYIYVDIRYTARLPASTPPKTPGDPMRTPLAPRASLPGPLGDHQGSLGAPSDRLIMYTSKTEGILGGKPGHGGATGLQYGLHGLLPLKQGARVPRLAVKF